MSHTIYVHSATDPKCQKYHILQVISKTSIVHLKCQEFVFTLLSGVFPVSLVGFPLLSVFRYQGAVMLLFTYLEPSCLLIHTPEVSCQHLATLYLAVFKLWLHTPCSSDCAFVIVVLVLLLERVTLCLLVISRAQVQISLLLCSLASSWCSIPFVWSSAWTHSCHCFSS